MKKKEKQVGAGEFKAQCLQIIDEVNHSRIPIVITKHGKPLVKLVPYDEQSSRLFGCLENTILIHADIVGSTDESWDADA
jgi:prevent-host-death family protein